MKIPKLFWVAFLIIGIVAIYAFWPDGRTAIDNGIASIVIVFQGFADSIVVTPLWQTYFAPYAWQWAAIGGFVSALIVWYAFVTVRKWFVRSAAKEAPIYMGGPQIGQPQVVVRPPQQVQPNPQPEQKKES